MPRLLINDGFTLDRKIKTGYDYPEFSVKYRPAMPEEVYQYGEDMASASTGAAKNKVFSKFVAKHLVGWDVEDEKGLAEITDVNVGRLPHALHGPLADVITGYARKELETDAKN